MEQKLCNKVILCINKLPLIAMFIFVNKQGRCRRRALAVELYYNETRGVNW